MGVAKEKSDLLPGTLDMLVLKIFALSTERVPGP
jgi:hypothetical protein